MTETNGGRILAIALCCALACTVSAGNAKAAVVINEVLGNTTSTDTEYIELYNTGPGAVDISGWEVELWDSDAGGSFGTADAASPYVVPALTTLLVGDYYLMANPEAELQFGVVADLALPANAIENSSYTIVLADSSGGTVIDAFFVTDGGVGDEANRMGATPFVPPGGTIGPDGTFLPAGFYRVGDGLPNTALLEFSPVPAPSGTPGVMNLGEANGACCDTGDPSTCTVVTPTACTGIGGTYQGDGTVCAEGTCNPLGACCFAIGTCSELEEETCTGAGGTFQGDGTSCTPNPCPQPTGNCCIASVCSVLTEADCLAGSGTWFGPFGDCLTGDQCAPIPLIITEVVDGDISGGVPKYLEITNPTGAAYTFPGGGVAMGFNGGAVSLEVDLTGEVIAAGQSYVVAWLGTETMPGSGIFTGQEAFNNTYGFDADFYDANLSGNGDDVYALTNYADAAVLSDVYGEVGVDGTGTVWEYTDSHACRDTTVTTPNGGTFDTSEWSFFGADALDGVDDTESAALLLANTTPTVNSCPTLPVGACCPGGGARGGGCATCPGDMDGNGVIDLADVPGFVDALTGVAPDPCADIQPDTFTNGADIQGFTDLILAQATCGAPCSVVTQVECESGGGTYLGDGTDCTGDPCAAPTGGCCTGSTCTVETQADCTAGGGAYYGDDVPCGTFLCPIDNSGVVINEIRIDQAGADNDEYFELAGTPGTLLDGLWYIVVGDHSASLPGCPAPGPDVGCRSGNIETAVDLSGSVIPADGRFLAAEDTFSLGATPDLLLSSVGIWPFGGDLNFENNDNVTHMLVRDFTGMRDDSNGIDLDRDGTPDAVLPWSSVQDAIAVVNIDPPVAETDEFIYTFGFTQIGPDPTDTTAPDHLYRFQNGAVPPDGAGKPWNIGPASPPLGDDTPGIENNIVGACCVVIACTIESPEDCAGLGGTYLGTGSDCSGPNPCQGACCEPGGGCTLVEDLLAGALCVAPNAYAGRGSVCPDDCLACSTIADARALPIGTPVKLCDVVITNTVNFVGGSNGSFNVQDTSGAGGQSALQVFSFDGVKIAGILTGKSLGHRIDIQGTTAIFNGLFELSDGVTPLALVTDLGAGAVPAPVAITMTDLQDGSVTAEGLESEIVELSCISVDAADCTALWQGGGGAGNYTIRDAVNDTATLRISSSAQDFVGTIIPSNEVTVTGILGQFDSSDPRDCCYQIQPRSNGTEIAGLNDIDENDVTCAGEPIGACCDMIDGTCTPSVEECTCLAGGGIFLGDGSDCSAGCPTDDSTCLIISEVVDGNITGGVPKWIEITNTGSVPFIFTGGGVIVQTNAAVDYAIDVSLTGLIISVGQSYVICGTGGSQTQFPIVYGFEADLYAAAINGNGDDRYALTANDFEAGATLIDIYGVDGVSGAGQTWEYTDGYAVRNAAANSGNSGVFVEAEWSINLGALIGADDTENTTLLQTLTTPKTHTFDPCGAGGQCNVNARDLNDCVDGVDCNTQSEGWCWYQVTDVAVDPSCDTCTDTVAISVGATISIECGADCPDEGLVVFRWIDGNGAGMDCWFEALATPEPPGGTGNCQIVLLGQEFVEAP